VESVRLHHFKLNSTWHPSGLAQTFAPPCREGISGKRVADALEGLIGVVYESVGLDGISEWLSTLYLLPKRDRVTLLQRLCSALVKLLKAGARNGAGSSPLLAQTQSSV
jgi:hypothetical protein